MKCPQCWAQKVRPRRVETWKKILWACLLLQPVKCNHCFHKFVISWFRTLDKPGEPPRLRIAAGTGSARESYAAQQHRTTPTAQQRPHGRSDEDNRRRAEAA
jgi:hypothetical protein